MKDKNSIFSIIILILTFILAGTMILLYKEVKTIENQEAKELVCIPLIKEDYYGDHYFLECLDRAKFTDDFKKINGSDKY